MSKNILKAVRTTVDIADIDVRGLMMPDGKYRMSNTDAGKAIDEGPRSFGNFLSSKGFKSAPGKGSAPGKTSKVKVVGENAVFNASPIDLVAMYWASFGISNPKAYALTVALSAETIQRRFDRAFGVKVSEAEYDAALALRLQRLTARHDWTDVLRDRMIQQGYYHDKVRVQSEFKALTIIVNMALFNQPHFCCDRDNMTPDQQQLIGDFERAAKRKAIQMPDASPAALVDAALLIF